MTRPAYPGDPVFEVIGLRLAALENAVIQIQSILIEMRNDQLAHRITGYQPDDEPVCMGENGEIIPGGAR